MPSVFDDVVGQRRTVEVLIRAAREPVHAYLFVGPPGSTKHQAARGFAALLLTGTEESSSRDAQLVLRGEHPDVREFERSGPAISADQAREIGRVSALAPTESDRKVMMLHEFHLLRPEGAALLLKTIEEPPASTIFVILADFMSHDLVTISSRCAQISFRSIEDTEIADRLVTEGVDPESAAQAATASGGDLSRARLLTTDPELGARRRSFAEAPSRLDGTGAAVMRLTDELVGLVDSSTAPLVQRHDAEVAALDERIARYGERGSGKKALEERHKRELRRHRTDEFRHGLALMAVAYRDAMVAGTPGRGESAAVAVSRIHAALAALDRNPNEQLLLQALLWSLPPLQPVSHPAR
jgi:DNA polymerase-3 subunit delta'